MNQTTTVDSPPKETSFEHLVADISGRFFQTTARPVDEEIQYAFAAMAGVLDVDRCFSFLLDPEECTQHRVRHMWTDLGIAPDSAVIGNIMQDVFPWVGSMMSRQEDIVVNRLDDLPPEANRERKYCQDRGIQSFLMYPIYAGNVFVGNIGVDSVRTARSWSEAQIGRLRLVGEIIANTILRQQREYEIALLKERLEAENSYLREEIQLRHSHGEIVGESDALKSVLARAERVAETQASVLILGETGTGKELLANVIHHSSPRRERSFVSVNCAALSPTLIESELFGREKGAYTGAVGKQVGRFEIADGGTIFLDEIGELPLDLQAKLLRVLQCGEFERLGSPRTIRVDVRVVAATNRDLVKAMREGSFRRDLYYRLNVFPITVPPLRDRRDDIPLLVWAFVKKLEKAMGRYVERISPRSMEALKTYSWPGNVRELRNVIERAMILCRGKTLIVDLPAGATDTGNAKLVKTLAEMERDYIRSMLERTGWRVSGERGAAKLLGLKPTTLDSRMKKLGILRP